MLTLRLWCSASWEMVELDSQPIELQSLFLKDCGPTALTQKPLTTLCPARVLQHLSQLREVGMDSRPMENLWPEQRFWELRPRRGWRRPVGVPYQATGRGIVLRLAFGEAPPLFFQGLSGFSLFLMCPSDLTFPSPGLSAQRASPLAPAHTHVHTIRTHVHVCMHVQM